MKKNSRLPKNYNLQDFDRPSVTVDIVVFSILNGVLKILLIQRNILPFKGSWALPGGFVKMKETLDQAASRELLEETGIKKIYMEQLYTFGDIKRDPRTRVITIAYLALLPTTNVGLKADTDVADVKWFSVNKLPALAFDHQSIVSVALDRLKAKLQYSNIVKGLLPLTFTLGELQKTYEAVLGHPIDKRNFRKKIHSLDLLTPLEKLREGSSHRPAALYKFRSRDLVFFD